MSTTTSTTVDLSRLPAPIVVEQLTFDQIVAQMVATLREELPAFDATIDSDPAVKVMHVAAYRELIVRQAFQDGALQLFVAYATGTRLDHLAALVGVTRQIVTPADPATGAVAIYEDDDRLRQRIVLAPEGFSVAGPELAYVKHAKDASADVLDASATSPAPGEVLVSVLYRGGDGTAPAALIAKVAAIVTAPGIRPLGDHVTVRAYEGNMQVGNAFAGNLHLCTGAINRWTIQSAGHFAAAADNVYSIGTAALRASVIYAGTSLINTSDEREKTWRGAMTDTERLAAKAIVAELGFYQWNDAIAEKGDDDARYHFGARAQRVWTIMADHGLVDPLDSDGLPARTPYAFLCFDQWDDVFEDVMTEEFGPPQHGEGMSYIKTGERLIMPAGNRFGLREGQMTLFLLGALLG